MAEEGVGLCAIAYLNRAVCAGRLVADAIGRGIEEAHALFPTLAGVFIAGFAYYGRFDRQTSDRAVSFRYLRNRFIASMTSILRRNVEVRPEEAVVGGSRGSSRREVDIGSTA